MKKLVLSIAALLSVGIASAQEGVTGFSKGDVFATGAIAVNSSKDNNAPESKSSFFLIAPQVNYFLTDNISLGARVAFISDKEEANNVDTRDLSTVAFGLQGRYYFTPASQFSLFTGLGFDYVTTTNNLSNPELKENGFDAGLGLGLNYFIAKNFSLEASFAAVQYSTRKLDVPNSENETSLDFGGNLSALTIGLNYRF